MLSFWDFQIKLKRREISNCCQKLMHWKESPKKCRMKPASLKVFAGTPRENKKDYVMGSHSKTCETYYYLEQSFFSWKKKKMFFCYIIVFVCLILHLVLKFCWSKIREKYIIIKDKSWKNRYIFIKLVREKIAGNLGKIRELFFVKAVQSLYLVISENLTAKDFVTQYKSNPTKYFRNFFHIFYLALSRFYY